MNSKDTVITNAMCEALTQHIKTLRHKDEWYRRKLTNKKISEQTKIPFGSIGIYLANDSLPLHRYSIVKQYVDTIVEEYLNFPYDDRGSK